MLESFVESAGLCSIVRCLHEFWLQISESDGRRTGGRIEEGVTDGGKTPYVFMSHSRWVEGWIPHHEVVSQLDYLQRKPLGGNGSGYLRGKIAEEEVGGWRRARTGLLNNIWMYGAYH
jgi:hypothetical protein